MYDGTLFPYGKNFPQPPLRLRAAQARRMAIGQAAVATQAPSHATPLHTRAHAYARTKLSPPSRAKFPACVGYGGWRGGGHGGATRGRRAHNKRESQAPSREATKHGVWLIGIGDQGSGVSKAFVEFL